MDNKIIPYGKIDSIESLGQLIKYRRKELNATQQQVAGLSGVGVRYLSELERGKKTIEIGKALQVINRLGLELQCSPRKQNFLKAVSESGVLGDE